MRRGIPGAERVLSDGDTTPAAEAATDVREPSLERGRLLLDRCGGAAGDSLPQPPHTHLAHEKRIAALHPRLLVRACLCVRNQACAHTRVHACLRAGKTDKDLATVYLAGAGAPASPASPCRRAVTRLPSACRASAPSLETEGQGDGSAAAASLVDESEPSLPA